MEEMKPGVTRILKLDVNKNDWHSPKAPQQQDSDAK